MFGGYCAAVGQGLEAADRGDKLEHPPFVTGGVGTAVSKDKDFNAWCEFKMVRDDGLESVLQPEGPGELSPEFTLQLYSHFLERSKGAGLCPGGAVESSRALQCRATLQPPSGIAPPGQRPFLVGCLAKMCVKLSASAPGGAFRRASRPVGTLGGRLPRRDKEAGLPSSRAKLNGPSASDLNSGDI